jgi:hypothetical protein
MEEREYFETSVSNTDEDAEVVLEALYVVYDMQSPLNKPDLDWLVQHKTNFHREDIGEITDKLFDKEKPYLMLDNERVVFGTMGLWLLEDASFSLENAINPIDTVLRNLESNSFFKKLG